MFQNNPQAMVVMAMLLQEERHRNRARRSPIMQGMNWQIDLARKGQRLAGRLGALLVTMGQRLQSMPGESGSGI